MFWFQDFSDDVFVFSSFLGAGFTEGSHLFFRSQALPDTNTQKSSLTSGENLCLDLQGKMNNSGLPKGGRCLSGSDLKSMSSRS